MHTLILNTAEEIGIVKAQVEAAPQGGFDLGAMKSALELSKLLDDVKPGEPWELADKDYGFLQNKMRSAKWTVAHADIVDLVERCLNAPRAAEEK